jgi:hypothetical protein
VNTAALVASELNNEFYDWNQMLTGTDLGVVGFACHTCHLTRHTCWLFILY